MAVFGTLYALKLSPASQSRMPTSACACPADTGFGVGDQMAAITRSASSRGRKPVAPPWDNNRIATNRAVRMPPVDFRQAVDGFLQQLRTSVRHPYHFSTRRRGATKIGGQIDDLHSGLQQGRRQLHGGAVGVAKNTTSQARKVASSGATKASSTRPRRLGNS